LLGYREAMKEVSNIEIVDDWWEKVMKMNKQKKQKTGKLKIVDRTI